VHVCDRVRAHRYFIKHEPKPVKLREVFDKYIDNDEDKLSVARARVRVCVYVRVCADDMLQCDELE
jgi:hypothetical protein